MVEMIGKETSHWWWLETHKRSRRSMWLQSTLAELDRKTKGMLKLIEEDADSFAQRAEMYYKKRPELISMVEDFYRAHRSLAERYDLVKSDSGARLQKTFLSPISIMKSQSEKFRTIPGQIYRSFSENYDTEESAESELSEVDDPEPEDVVQIDDEREVEDDKLEIESQVFEGSRTRKVSGGICNDEVAKLREEIEKLKEENRIQRDQLLQKDEEKRDVIRHLSVAVDVLKEENLKLRKSIARDSPMKLSPFEFSKLKWNFFGRFASSQPVVLTL
ncbi:hypothetical protein HS088_TW17G00233 [Tripterygium wilfordii]|uniref:NAB domain-containing protein n=1 Tax=Tripterygium wilfordii TaxID=458696 RepID=A0A7J7CEZ3_TRIWF|nr:protein NETWORKED 3C-like [Tripterygium wilfordii]XP_038680613.1 protein NETWORKED 3C-like [Tripterygium wilfordii]KAF5732703.1 hypothetical protein HS088_TW17G00233 [Tripterygium wilfordii]